MPAPVRGHCVFTVLIAAGQPAIQQKSPGWALVRAYFNAAAMFDEPGRRYYTSHFKSCRQGSHCRRMDQLLFQT